MKLYFDESGQTGAHLFDPEQPYFTIGSTNVDDGEALRILDRCFPKRQGGELKSQNVLRKPQGRRSFLEFARVVGSDPERFCTVKIGKRFAVVSKMVDFLVEPLLRAQGYDFYAGDYAARFANSACFVFQHLLDPADADSLMDLYNEFAQEPGPATLAPLRSALDDVERRGPRGSEVTLGLMAQGARHFDALHGPDGFKDSNDVHVTAMVRCMAHWQSRDPGPFDIVHDESTHFFERSKQWMLLTNPDIEPMVLTLGDKTLTLPIPVASTVAGRSHEHPSLQLCDLVAGFVRWSASPTRTDGERGFVREAVEAGMGKLAMFSVDAGTEFVSGPPERSTGPDIVDRIMEAARPQPKG